MSRWCTTGSIAALADPLGDLLGEHHRAVRAPGAADRDREVGLALADIGGKEKVEQVVEAVEQLGRLVDCRGRSRAPAASSPLSGRSAGDPVRVRQEAAVEDEVDVERDARA